MPKYCMKIIAKESAKSNSRTQIIKKIRTKRVPTDSKTQNGAKKYWFFEKSLEKHLKIKESSFIMNVYINVAENYLFYAKKRILLF